MKAGERDECQTQNMACGKIRARLSRLAVKRTWQAKGMSRRAAHCKTATVKVFCGPYSAFRNIHFPLKIISQTALIKDTLHPIGPDLAP